MSETLVAELVDGIFDAVTTETVEAPSTCNGCAVEDGDHYLADLLRGRLQEQISLNFITRRSRVEVFQLKCLEQRASGYCGHYALFFALKMLEACHSGQPLDNVCRYFKLTTDPVLFWKCYWRTISVLLAEATLSQGGWWPWTEDHIIGGDMERSFLSFILATDSDVLTLNTNDNIHVLHYAYGLIQSSEEEVCAIQQRIDKLRQSQHDKLVFILGVTNHWVALLLHKSQTSGISLVYLDSNNEPVLMASEGGLCQLVQAREDKYRKRKGKPYTEWKRKVLYQSFVDQRDVVHLLMKCVVGENDLRGELSTQTWSKLLDSYDQVVGSKGEDPDLHLACLVEWLEEHYPSRVILSHHVAMLIQFHEVMDGSVLHRIKTWVKGCGQHLAHTHTGLENVEEFYSTIAKLKDVLDREN